MFRGPIVITSLEEDFKKIGLLSEDKQPVAPDSDEEHIEGQENMTDEEIAEAVRVRRRTVKGKRTMKPTKRTPTRLKMKAKRLYRKKKAKIKLQRRKKMRKPMVRRRMKFLAKRRQKLHQGNPTIANLIEDVSDIVGSLNGGAASIDSIKSFANIAIISDMLANTFTEWSSDLNESELDEAAEETLGVLQNAAESLTDLAEAAAEIATGLKEGQSLGGDVALEDLFREYMSDMLEGMDIYNEASKSAKAEDDAEDVEEDSDEPDDTVEAKDDDEDEDDDEDDSDDDDDEDEDDEVDEKKKK